PGVDVDPLRRAVELPAPYRVEAVRRAGRIWALGARRIQTVELSDDPGGDEVELVWDGSERSVRVDGTPTLAGVPVLEALGAARASTYVVTAARLAGSTWEVSVAAL
ncbi:MAG: hypothetical protein ACRC50_06905, partial [Gaiella sp.]